MTDGELRPLGRASNAGLHPGREFYAEEIIDLVRRTDEGDPDAMAEVLLADLKVAAAKSAELDDFIVGPDEGVALNRLLMHCRSRGFQIPTELPAWVTPR